LSKAWQQMSSKVIARPLFRSFSITSCILFYQI